MPLSRHAWAAAWDTHTTRSQKARYRIAQRIGKHKWRAATRAAIPSPTPAKPAAVIA